jgi:Flp pilus assembly protein TadD
MLSFFEIPGRSIAALALCAALNGCASLKAMTADFERKWDEPESILAEMDKTGRENRAAESSAEKMAAFNANDCVRKFDLLNDEADKETLAARRISAGECLLQSGRNDEAVKVFSLADGEADAVALQGKGVALVRLEKYDEATAALQSAVDLDPTLWRAYNALGVAADYRGMKEEAWAHFREAALLNPADGAALNNLGVSYLKADRREEAIDSFRQAMALDGAREAAEANLRLAHALGGDYASAVKALPDDRRPIALNNAGVAAATRGDKTEARRLFNRALEESPHFYAKAYNNLSLLIE